MRLFRTLRSLALLGTTPIVSSAQTAPPSTGAEPFVAVSSLTGPSEVWYMQAFPSWEADQRSIERNRDNPAQAAAVDKQCRRMEEEYLNDSRLREVRRLAKEAHTKARLNEKRAMYEATAGSPSGTSYIFIARPSLADITVPPPGWIEANPGFWKPVTLAARKPATPNP